MRKINTSNISNTVGMPIKSGTLEHLQNAYKELTDLQIKPLIPNPITDQLYILQGAENSGTGNNYVISSGVAYLNGELYELPAVSFTKTASQIAAVTINTQFFTTNADPVQFTDGTNANVHEIRTIRIEAKASIGNINYDNAIRVEYWLSAIKKEQNNNTNNSIFEDSSAVVSDGATYEIYVRKSGNIVHLTGVINSASTNLLANLNVLKVINPLFYPLNNILNITGCIQETVSLSSPINSFYLFWDNASKTLKTGGLMPANSKFIFDAFYYTN